MRILLAILIACSAVIPNVARAVCVPNFYAIDVELLSPDKQALDKFWKSFEPNNGNKCGWFEPSATPQGFKGQIYCMYKLQMKAPPKTVKLAALIDTLAALTPKTGGEDGQVEIGSVKSRVTCKPGGGGGCVRVQCSSGTMDVPNCRACGPTPR